MLTTSLLALIFIGSEVFLLFLSAWMLKTGARWAKLPQLSLKRALATVLLIATLQLVLGWASSQDLRNIGIQPAVALALQPLLLLLGLFVIWRSIQSMLRTSFGKAMLAWLLILLVNTAGGVVLVMVVIRPFFFEAFKVSTNAMAPTLLGMHYRTTCLLCGQVGFVSTGEHPRASSDEEELGICGGCLQASEMRLVNHDVHQGDRIVVAKFLTPLRWDLIAFRFPEEPSVVYVKRLVGLPGEEVTIKDGGVWIDRKPIQKPGTISGLVYLANPFSGKDAGGGPWCLGNDEYFVLGDFSRRSKDSRLWERGAPGHPPYAVPRSHFVGVTTHVYWPPTRWRVLR
jgi:signal peptidase I